MHKRKPYHRFWRNLTRTSRAWGSATSQMACRSDDMDGLCEFVAVAQGFFLFLFLGHAHRSHWWTNFDELCVIWCLSTQGSQVCALWGLCWYRTPLWGHIPKVPILGVWIGVFKPNRQLLKLSYDQNYQIDSNQILHNDDPEVLFVNGQNIHNIVACIISATSADNPRALCLFIFFSTALS